MAVKMMSFIIIFCLLNLVTGQDILFPHGASEGDTLIPSNDDGNSGTIWINTLFPFFDSNHDFLFVNTNGVISFLIAVSQYTPDPFPMDGNRRFITPYWGDIDTGEGGTNSYRELLRAQENEDLFQRADNIIYDAFIGHDKFVSTWMFIATWDRVGFYGSTASHIVNTFQVVIITNGRHSFTIHNYGDIMWTTGTASGGDSNTGLGGTPAQVYDFGYLKHIGIDKWDYYVCEACGQNVCAIHCTGLNPVAAGFNAGDGVRYYSIPGSRTPSIVDIEETTNVGTTGRWVFRVDSAEVEDSGCNTAGTIIVYPIVGSMLGGEVILIQGPCFNDTVEIKCKFQGEEVPGELVSNTTASCVTPTLFVAGRIHLAVSLDGGETYDFEGIYTMLTPDQVVPGIQRINGRNWYNQDEVTITWDTEIFKDILNFIDIHVLAYSENPTSRTVLLVDLGIVAERVDYSIGTLTFSLYSGSPNYGMVGVLKLLAYTESVDGVLPALWSDIHSLQWLYRQNLSPSSWCLEWVANEFQNLEFLSETEPCPCTLRQALVDTARFSPHPECDVDVNSTDNCVMRPGAVHCIRATEPSSLGGGQECCFGEDEDILSVFFSDGGGFAYRHHHVGVSPQNQPGKVAYLSNFYHDIQPWEQCCYHSEENCAYYKDVRPSHTCENYVPPTPGGGSGDPHILTLDGTSYTFNGVGEHTMVTANNKSFILQARMGQPSSSVDSGFRVTAFSAVAAKFDNSDTVHVEVNEIRVLDVWIREHEQSAWTKLDFEVSPTWSLNGIFITGSDVSESGVLIVFAGGASIELKATHDVMSILFLGPKSFLNNTDGLMGTWNNDPTDDYRLPDGTILPPDSSARDLHSFGKLWEISAETSLFYYPHGFDYNDFRDPLFDPVFEPPQNPNIDPDLLLEVCQGNEWCIFDFQATEDQDIAAASKVAYEETKAVINASKEVVMCGPLNTPKNGSKQLSKSTVGGVAIFSCSPGFILEGNEELACLPSGEWSGEPPLCVSTATPNPTEKSGNGEDDKLVIIIASAVGAVVALLLIAILMCVCCKKKNKNDVVPLSDNTELQENVSNCSDT